MNSGDILLLTGLGFATIGALALAIDPWFGPGVRNRVEIEKLQLENLQRFRADMKSMTLALPQPPWTADELNRQIAEQDAQYGPKENELRSAIDSGPDRHEDLVAYSARLGVAFLVIAFVLQFIGTLLVAIDHSS